MFGALIKNNNNDEIIYGPEVTYQYWGRKSVTFTSGGSENIISLFDIPDSWEPVIFCKVNTSMLNAQVDTTVVSGVTHGRCICTDSPAKTITATFYIFVPCHRVSLNTYGMAVWNDNGVLAYHTSRPMLMVDLVSNEDQTTPYPCAVNPTYMGQALERTSRNTIISDLCSYGLGSSVRTSRFIIGQMPPVPNEIIRYNVFIAIINTSYYDSFPNLT